MEWTSPATEDLWHERIRRVGRAFVDLERRSVAGGIRSVCRLDVTPAELADRQQYYREQGLILYPVGRKKLPSAVTFEHALDAPRKGQPWIYITALSSTTQDALAFRNAWLSNDHPAVGRLLGYPLCCTEFFSTAWACGYVDPVWQMACNSRCTADNTRGGHVLTAIGDPHLNPLLRYLGVRLVPHLAHSLDCPASIKLARQFVELGWALGYGDEMGWAEELLALPSEWSVQRGIARIKAPLFRFLAKSVPTTSQWSVFFESAPPESMPPAERSQTPSPSLIAERLRSRLV